MMPEKHANLSPRHIGQSQKVAHGQGGKLDFYAEVMISEHCEDPQCRGKTGVILGITEDEHDFYGYAVALHEDQECVSVGKHEVVPTGRMFCREDFYDGTTISVSMNGELLPPRDQT